MRKAFIIFIVIFLLTALIPLFSLAEKKEESTNEIVTIFSDEITSERG